MAAEQTVRIGKNIRRLREAAGLTQHQLANLIPGKTDNGQVSKWERGEHRPGDDTLEHIAKALKCDVADLLLAPPEEGTPDLMGVLSPAVDEPWARLERKLDELQVTVLRIAELLFEQGLEDADEREAPPETGTGEGAGE